MDMVLNIEIAERLRLERINLRITQRDVQLATGIAASSISQYESGTSIPSAEILKKLCQFYRCSADYILGLKQNYTVNVDDLDKPEIAAINQVVNTIRRAKGIEVAAINSDIYRDRFDDDEAATDSEKSREERN